MSSVLKENAPNLSRPSRSGFGRHAPGFPGLNGTGIELELEPHCGDDLVGAKVTMFRTSRDLTIPRVISSPFYFSLHLPH